MSVKNMKHFIYRYKEVLMFLAGFGAMHYGWYNLQRNSTLNKALAASRDKELAKEYKRLEKEINENNWSEKPQQQQQYESQKPGVILTAATTLTKKSNAF